MKQYLKPDAAWVRRARTGRITPESKRPTGAAWILFLLAMGVAALLAFLNHVA